MKKWEILQKSKIQNPLRSSGQANFNVDEVVDLILENRGLATKQDIEAFLHPTDPLTLTPRDVEIEPKDLARAIKRILKAVDAKESIVVYADYDADGITAGAVMWEALHTLGASVMPYIPHRVEEGYGLSIKGIDAVVEQFHPTLIVTVDHGITAKEKVAYAKSLGIDVVVSDHHVKPDNLPDCTIVHTTKLSGAGISWFIAKELLKKGKSARVTYHENELLALASIGTIADMVPLVGPNRSIAKFGLAVINRTERVGLDALLTEAGLTKGNLGTYEISHVLAPRLNAMGRIVHAMDALRLLCTHRQDKAQLLAEQLGLTNKERQQMTEDTVLHAKDIVVREKRHEAKRLLFIVDESYNQGVIGLVAGKLVEQFYRPSIVVAKGELVSKASARSIAGFNIVEAIRSCSDILVDVGGHPMAAGFTVETKNLDALQERLEELAEKELDDEKLTRSLKIDVEIPLDAVTDALWQKLRDFEPFGFGNTEPVFSTRSVKVIDARLVGTDGRHLKLRIRNGESGHMMDAIAFGLGNMFGQLQQGNTIDIAYTIDQNVWNGNTKIQLKIKDIHIS